MLCFFGNRLPPRHVVVFLAKFSEVSGREREKKEWIESGAMLRRYCKGEVWCSASSRSRGRHGAVFPGTGRNSKLTGCQ